MSANAFDFIDRQDRGSRATNASRSTVNRHLLLKPVREGTASKVAGVLVLLVGILLATFLCLGTAEPSARAHTRVSGPVEQAVAK